MSDLVIGPGKLSGKGVYAGRNYGQGEVVMSYNLRQLSVKEFNSLPKEEQIFTHSFWGKIYLYPEPARYVNHSATPNTRQDLEKMCDYAVRPIKKGEMITTNATQEIQKELETLLEVRLDHPIQSLKWTKLGYRNASCEYTVQGKRRSMNLKRISGNWQIIKSS